MLKPFGPALTISARATPAAHAVSTSANIHWHCIAVVLRCPPVQRTYGNPFDAAAFTSAARRWTRAHARAVHEDARARARNPRFTSNNNAKKLAAEAAASTLMTP